MFALTEEIVDRVLAVDRYNDLIVDVVFPERPQGQALVVDVVFD
jgi:hypothetical protein